METTTDEMTQAKNTISAILEEINLETYLFEVSPREGQWLIRIECALDEGWENFNFTADRELLLRGEYDAVVHQFLLDEWRDGLSSCKRK